MNISKLLSIKDWFSYRQKVGILVCLGVIVGLGGLFMYLLRAHTYLGDDPSACVNCHIMTPYYATWSHSSHGRDATCNDCHVPHSSLLAKYGFKAVDGLKHTAYFVTHSERQAIMAEDMSAEVIMDNCIHCHTQLNQELVSSGRIDYMMAKRGEGKACWDCHRNVPHSGVNSLISTPILKAQHLGYEIALQGIHGQRGVSCADCHMPYKQEGGVKFSDHHIMSPLAHIDRTCQTCHRQDAETLRQNVYERQEKCNEVRNRAEKELAAAHIEAKFAIDHGATEAEMKPIQALLRKSQWRWDYSIASHGATFHAPQEVVRLLAASTSYAQQARLQTAKLLAKKGFTGDIPLPDISTKAKAQAYIGLDMPKLNEKKQKFLNEIVPKWIDEAKKNGKLIEI